MSLMLSEAREAANCVARQNDQEIASIAHAIKAESPKGLLTTARGSSDHAVAFLSYLFMRYSGLPAASIPPSLSSMMHNPWHVHDFLALGVSQSGASPDLVAAQKSLREGGAKTLALTNTVPSPLAEISEWCINIQAGTEKSVAATKSFIATLTAGVRLLSHWFDDQSCQKSIAALPEKLHQAAHLDWHLAVEKLKARQRLYILGRGAGLGIAEEAALKCKETCLMQGEAFSSAEVKHGPMAIVNEEMAVLVFAPPGKLQNDLIATAHKFKEMGATVLLAADESVADRDLPLIDAGHELLQGITTIQSFYVMAAMLAEARGLNPDQPPHLKKVTETH